MSDQLNKLDLTYLRCDMCGTKGGKRYEPLQALSYCDKCFPKKKYSSYIKTSTLIKMAWSSYLQLEYNYGFIKKLLQKVLDLNYHDTLLKILDQTVQNFKD